MSSYVHLSWHSRIQPWKISNGSVGHMDMQSDRSSPGHSELSAVVVVGFLVVVVLFVVAVGVASPF